MRKYLITCALTCFSLILNAQNQKNFIDQNYIEITGTAKKQVVPDEIYISITLTEKNHKKTIEEQERMLLANLKSLGVDLDKDFSVSNFKGNYTRHFLKRNEVEKIKQYQLIVHDGSMLSKTFTVLDQLNITNANITKVDHSEIEKIRRQTKINSLKAAKEKAAQYAEAIDQKIGKALFIQENDPSNYYPNYKNKGFNTSNTIVAQGYASTIDELAFQQITVTASVLTRFELKTSKD